MEFTKYSEPRCRIGVANADSYRDLVRRFTDEAVSIFDGELGATTGTELSRRGEAALFLLRKCSYSLPTVLAIRQLAAARVTHQLDKDRRLLTSFSRELKVAEDVLDRRVVRHLRHLRSERTPIFRPTTEAPGMLPVFVNSVKFYSVRKQDLKSLVPVRPKMVTATLKSDAESRSRELLRTKALGPKRASAVFLPHSGTVRHPFEHKNILDIRTPSTGFASPTAPYGTAFLNVQEEYEFLISRNKQFGGNTRTTTGGKLGKTRLRDLNTCNFVALAG